MSSRNSHLSHNPPSPLRPSLNRFHISFSISPTSYSTSSITTMDRLTATGDHQERRTGAETSKEHRLEAIIKLLGESRPHTLTIMGNLATWYEGQAQWSDADALEEKISAACIKLPLCAPATCQTTEHGSFGANIPRV